MSLVWCHVSKYAAGYISVLMQEAILSAVILPLQMLKYARVLLLEPIRLWFGVVCGLEVWIIELNMHLPL